MSDKGNKPARADHATRFSATRQPEKTGRPKESRDRLSRAFLTALADDFEEHGVEAIQQLREEDKGTYVRVVASLQPKEFEVTDPLRGMTDDKLVEAIGVLTEALREKAPPAEPENPQHTVN